MWKAQQRVELARNVLNERNVWPISFKVTLHIFMNQNQAI